MNRILLRQHRHQQRERIQLLTIMFTCCCDGDVVLSGGDRSRRRARPACARQRSHCLFFAQRIECAGRRFGWQSGTRRTSRSLSRKRRAQSEFFFPFLSFFLSFAQRIYQSSTKSNNNNKIKSAELLIKLTKCFVVAGAITKIGLAYWILQDCLNGSA